MLIAFLASKVASATCLSNSNPYGAGMTMQTVANPLTRKRATILAATLSVIVAVVLAFLAPNPTTGAWLVLVTLLVPVAAVGGVALGNRLRAGAATLVAPVTLLIAVAVGLVLVVVLSRPTEPSGAWAIGPVVALVIGVLGLLIGPRTPAAELAADSGSPTDAREPIEDAEQPTHRASRGVPDGDEEAIDADEPLARGDLLAARSEVSSDRLAAEIESVLAPAPQRAALVEDADDVPQWTADHSRGLAGVFRREEFDEATKALADEYRPSRAMSPQEQDELEEMLESTGTIAMFIDDGSVDSPARPRRRAQDQ